MPYSPAILSGKSKPYRGPDATPVAGKIFQTSVADPYKLELVDLPGITIPGLNNELLTSDGAGGLVAESGLTFNGSRLEIPTGNVRVGGVGVTEITPLQISYLHGNGAGTYIGANGISVGPVAAYWFANGNAAATRDTRFQRVSANVVALKDAGTTLGTLQAATVTTGSSSIPLVLRDTVDIHSDGNGTLYRQTANQAHTFANAAGTAIGSFAMLSSVPLLVMGAQGSAPGIKYVAANTLSVVGNDRTTLGTLQAATIDNPSANLNLGSWGATQLYLQSGLIRPLASIVPTVGGVYDLGGASATFRTGYINTINAQGGTLALQTAGTERMTVATAAITNKVQTLIGANGDEGLLSWSGGNFVVRGASGKGLALGANNTNYVTIDTSGNATFGGPVKVSQTYTGSARYFEMQHGGGGAYIREKSGARFEFGTATSGYGLLFSTNNGYEALNLDASQNATFSGNILPDGASTRDIGSTSAEWKDVFATTFKAGTDQAAFYERARVYSSGSDFQVDNTYGGHTTKLHLGLWNASYGAYVNALQAGGTQAGSVLVALDATNTTTTSTFGVYSNVAASVANPANALFKVAENGSTTISGDTSIGGTHTATGKLDIDDDVVRVRTAKTPASAGAAGNQGDIAWDADYVYVCTATNTWKRTAIATW